MQAPPINYCLLLYTRQTLTYSSAHTRSFAPHGRVESMSSAGWCCVIAGHAIAIQWWGHWGESILENLNALIHMHWPGISYERLLSVFLAFNIQSEQVKNSINFCNTNNFSIRNKWSSSHFNSVEVETMEISFFFDGCAANKVMTSTEFHALIYIIMLSINHFSCMWRSWINI